MSTPSPFSFWEGAFITILCAVALAALSSGCAPHHNPQRTPEEVEELIRYTSQNLETAGFKKLSPEEECRVRATALGGDPTACEKKGGP